MEGNVLYALGLTLVAGAATGIGAIAALFAKKENTRVLAASQTVKSWNDGGNISSSAPTHR